MATVYLDDSVVDTENNLFDHIGTTGAVWSINSSPPISIFCYQGTGSRSPLWFAPEGYINARYVPSGAPTTQNHYVQWTNRFTHPGGCDFEVTLRDGYICQILFSDSPTQFAIVDVDSGNLGSVVFDLAQNTKYVIRFVVDVGVQQIYVDDALILETNDTVRTVIAAPIFTFDTTDGATAMFGSFYGEDLSEPIVIMPKIKPTPIDLHYPTGDLFKTIPVKFK